MGQAGGSLPAPNFRLLFESAPGLYLVLTAELRIVAVSDAYLGATMTRRDDILGRNLFEVFPDNPSDPAATGVANLRASLDRVLAQKRPDAMAVQKYDIRRPESDGGGFEERFWSPVNSPVFHADGTLAYIMHRVEDVTDFVRPKHVESERQEVTEALRARAGRMEAEVFRRAQEIQVVNAQLRDLHAELESRVRERTADLERALSDLVREVADRRRTEEALQQSEERLRQGQKLEAIGRLAGGIAHDFNNLLSVVLGYTEILLAQHGPNEPGRPELEEVLRAGQRAAELTRQLLAFSRQQVLDAKVMDLNEVVTSLSKMLRRVLGEHIEFTFLPEPRLARIKADQSQIEQVVMNLVVNSRDAMPSGGRLTLSTANVELDESYARAHAGVSPGRYVLLAISDNGVGMDQATQARAFEPFFTTKERGKGTGLGLATVFGIVKQSGGHVWLYSEPDVGTTFRVYLPHCEGEVARPAAFEMRVSTGTETILLVDDDDQVRSVAGAILRKAGYHVLEARSPGEAILASEQHPVRIHLLVSDVVMPKMSGRDLAARIAARRSDIRVLFMSGYTNDAVIHHGVLDSGTAFVPKPLTPGALARKVREVLDAPRAHAPV